MKNSPNHTIFYDHQCPMCAAYTKGMVSAGMLQPGGRQAYSTEACRCHGVDPMRARNEIAVADHVNQRIHYGIDAMLEVIGQKWNWVKKVGHWPVVNGGLRVLYAFISYNRKVMAPPVAPEKNSECRPDTHLGWRWTYLVVTALFTAYVLSAVTPLFGEPVQSLPFWAEFVVCALQLGWQFAALRLLKVDQKLEYLGHMATVSAMGALALLPLLVLAGFATVHPAIAVVYFFAVVAGMFAEHVHRVNRLGMPAMLTWTWVAYRLLILTILLFLNFLIL